MCRIRFWLRRETAGGTYYFQFSKSKVMKCLSDVDIYYYGTLILMESSLRAILLGQRDGTIVRLKTVLRVGTNEILVKGWFYDKTTFRQRDSNTK